jgi:hypothetical protein
VTDRPSTRASAAGAARLETLSEAIERLARWGFRDSFQARGGSLFALTAAHLHAPEELCVREVVRFEGESDPGDGAVLFALCSRDGSTRGTLVAGYGTTVDAETASAMERLDATHATGSPTCDSQVSSE